jgi:uncharacterized iron-regulated membrane protein
MTIIGDTEGSSPAPSDVEKKAVAPAKALIRRVAMRPRRVVVTVHRWLSMALMAWLVVISITGAWLVVSDSVESRLHSERYAASEGDVGIQAAVDAALTATPDGSTVSSADTPSNSRGVYTVELSVPIEGAVAAEGEDPPTETLDVYVNPGSGEVNAITNPDKGVTHWMLRGHVNLWQQDGIFGVFDGKSGWCRLNADGAEPGGLKGVVCDVIPQGDDMIAWFAVGWIAVLLTGFYLWYWPGVRRWATAFVLRRGRGRFALNMSLHKTIGLVMWVPLTAIAFTGASFAFPNISRWYDNLTPAQRDFSLWTPAEDLVSEDAAGRQPLDFDDIAAVIAERFPDRALETLYPPSDETATYSAWVTRGFSPWTREGANGNTYLIIDQYTGETLYDGTPEEGNVFDQAWDDYSFPIHAGDVGGTTTRIIWFVVATSPLVLGATGIIMNRIRHRKRARRAGLTDEASDEAQLVDDAPQVSAGAAVSTP